MCIQNLSRVVSYQGDQRPRERREEWRTDNQKTRSNFFSDQDSLVTLSHWNYCTAESIFAQYIFGPVSTAGHLEAGSQGRVLSPMAALQQCSSYMKETLKTFKQFSKKATVGVRICQGTNTCEHTSKKRVMLVIYHRHFFGFSAKF